MHHFLSSPNYLSHFSCSHQQVGTLFLVIHLGSIMRYENEKNETHKSPILCSPCLHYIFVLLFLRENGGRRLKVSQYILHTCLASKNIFVQEGKNRTLMQSGNHVAVRNVIIQFLVGLSDPLRIQVSYQKKPVAKMPRILPNGYQNHCYLCLIYSPGTSFSALIPMSTEILKWAKKCAFDKRILIRFLSLSEVVKRYPIHPSSHFRNLTISYKIDVQTEKKSL